MCVLKDGCVALYGSQRSQLAAAGCGGIAERERTQTHTHTSRLLSPQSRLLGPESAQSATHLHTHHTTGLNLIYIHLLCLFVLLSTDKRSTLLWSPEKLGIIRERNNTISVLKITYLQINQRIMSFHFALFLLHLCCRLNTRD